MAAEPVARTIGCQLDETTGSRGERTVPAGCQPCRDLRVRAT